MERSRHSVSLDSLMLLVALLAAWFGVVRASRGLGIGLALLAVPALVRTGRVLSWYREAGRRVSPFDKTIHFFVSVAIVLVEVIPAVLSWWLAVGLCLLCGIPPGLAVVVALVPACGAGYGCHRMVAHAFDDTPQSS